MQSADGCFAPLSSDQLRLGKSSLTQMKSKDGGILGFNKMEELRANSLITCPYQDLKSMELSLASQRTDQGLVTED